MNNHLENLEKCSELAKAVADVARAFHPVRSQRQPTPPDSNLFRNAEKLVSEGIIASFDLYRDLRDATSEALFLSVYGNLYAFQMADKREKDEAATSKRSRVRVFRSPCPGWN